MKKHIVCFGDSNTHGLCADPNDCADGGNRFNENERWTCLLQKKLGDDYLVLEEGINGRTTVFPDPNREYMSGIDAIYYALMAHEPVDLLVIMLGTNDTRDRIGATAEWIGYGMERLIQNAKSIAAWKNDTPNILVIAPPPVRRIHKSAPADGYDQVKKSEVVPQYIEAAASKEKCHFINAGTITQFNEVDGSHLTKSGHLALAEKLSQIIPEIMNE